MAQICFDASAALAFALPDEPLHSQAVALVLAFAAQGTTLCAPAMFAYECDSVIRLRLWKGTLTDEEANTARAAIGALPILIEYDEADRDRAFEIAIEYDQPRCYDAAYAAHAEARGVELVTTDAPFFEAVNGSKKPKKATALTFVKLLAAT
jgi:predicted nucleic acid-binding protein